MNKKYSIEVSEKSNPENKYPYFDHLTGKRIIGTKGQLQKVVMILSLQQPKYTYSIIED